MLKRILPGICLLFCASILCAQEETIFSPEEQAQLEEWEDTIALLSYAVINDSLPEHRFGATKKLIRTLVTALQTPNSFQYPFQQVTSISIQYPADSTFRIFSWQLYVDEDEYRYYGAIQMNSEELQLFPLIDRSFSVEDIENTTLTADNWYGALYYNIQQFDTPQGPNYLLFGYDGYSFFDKRKLVEVLSFREGKPVFGAPVFVEQTEGGGQIIRNRLLLEYNAAASIKLNYDPVLKMVVFDHLILFGGQYVPDGSYEGYQLSNGYWQHVPKLFNEVSDEAPRPAPILDDKKDRDILGNKKG